MASDSATERISVLMTFAPASTPPDRDPDLLKAFCFLCERSVETLRHIYDFWDVAEHFPSNYKPLPWFVLVAQIVCYLDGFFEESKRYLIEGALAVREDWGYESFLYQRWVKNYSHRSLPQIDCLNKIATSSDLQKKIIEHLQKTSSISLQSNTVTPKLNRKRSRSLTNLYQAPKNKRVSRCDALPSQTADDVGKKRPASNPFVEKVEKEITRSSGTPVNMRKGGNESGAQVTCKHRYQDLPDKLYRSSGQSRERSPTNQEDFNKASMKFVHSANNFSGSVLEVDKPRSNNAEQWASVVERIRNRRRLLEELQLAQQQIESERANSENWQKQITMIEQALKNLDNSDSIVSSQ